MAANPGKESNEIQQNAEEAKQVAVDLKQLIYDMLLAIGIIDEVIALMSAAISAIIDKLMGETQGQVRASELADIAIQELKGSFNFDDLLSKSKDQTTQTDSNSQSDGSKSGSCATAIAEKAAAEAEAADSGLGNFMATMEVVPVPPPPTEATQSSSEFEEPQLNLAAWAALSSTGLQGQPSQAQMEAARQAAEGFDESSVQTSPPPPVEGFLYSNGISYNTPVVIGSFEFKPLWKAIPGYDVNTPSLDGQYLSPTGRLLDLQNVLKQAMTTSVLNFFSTVAGVTLGDDTSVTPIGNSNFSSELVSLSDSKLGTVSGQPSSTWASLQNSEDFIQWSVMVLILTALERMILSLNIKASGDSLVGDNNTFTFDDVDNNGWANSKIGVTAVDRTLKDFFTDDLKFDESTYMNSSPTALLVQLVTDLASTVIMGSFKLYDNDFRTQPNPYGTASTAEIATLNGSSVSSGNSAHGKLKYVHPDSIYKETSWSPTSFTPDDVSSLFFTQITSSTSRVAQNLHFVTRDFIIHLMRSQGDGSNFTNLFEAVSSTPTGATSLDTQSNWEIFRYVAGWDYSPTVSPQTLFGTHTSLSAASTRTSKTGAGDLWSLIVGLDSDTGERILSGDRISNSESSTVGFISGKDYFVSSMLTAGDGERFDVKRYTDYVTDFSTTIGDTSTGLTGMVLSMLGKRTSGNSVKNDQFFRIIVEEVKNWIPVSGMTFVSGDMRQQLLPLIILMAAGDDPELFIKVLDYIIYRYENVSSGGLDNFSSTLHNNHSTVGYGSVPISAHYWIRERVMLDHFETTYADRGSPARFEPGWVDLELGHTFINSDIGRKEVDAANGLSSLYIFPGGSGQGQTHESNGWGTGWGDVWGYGTDSASDVISDSAFYGLTIFDVIAEATRRFQSEVATDLEVTELEVGTNYDKTHPGATQVQATTYAAAPWYLSSDTTKWGTLRGSGGVGSEWNNAGVPFYGRVAVAMNAVIQLLRETLFVGFGPGITGGSYENNLVFSWNEYNALAVYEALDNYDKVGVVPLSQETADSTAMPVIGNPTLIETIKTTYNLSSLGDTTISQIENDALRTISFIADVKAKLNHEDLAVFNILHYLQKIKNGLDTNKNSAESFFSGAFGIDAYDEIFTKLKEGDLTDPNAGALLCQNITRDQISLSAALLSGLLQPATSQASPGPVYLPAAKAVFNDQFLNLMTWMSQTGFLPAAQEIGGRPRILVVGLPAGMMEYLRDETESNTGDTYYGESTFIKVVVHRKNLVSETESPSPLIYYFDTSKFIIEGIPGEESAITAFADTGSSTGIPDRTVNSVIENTRVKTFAFRSETPEALTKSVQNLQAPAVSVGKTSIRSGALTEPIGIEQVLNDHVFMNHVSDYYLKLYLRLGLGIDVNEDIFVAGGESSLGSGADDDATSILSDMALSALTYDQYFPKTGDESVQYQRLISEVSRSLLFSVNKYANSAFQFKMFDRVLCLLVYEQDPAFMSDDSGQVSLSHAAPKAIQSNPGNYVDSIWHSDYGNTGNDTAADQMALNDPSYYNFFVTVELATKPGEGLS